jgi:hypothetical protein
MLWRRRRRALLRPPAAALPQVWKNTAATAIVAMLGTVPGYLFCVAFIERMGRKTIQ